MSEQHQPLTEKTIAALQILAEHDQGLTAANFARLRWKDSIAWKRSYNTGNGATRGKGMWLSAGSYLAKLKKRGLVSFDDGKWSVSAVGKKLLDDSKI